MAYAPEVRYDGRGSLAAEHDKPLAEWLQRYPKLSEKLQACSLRFVVNLPEENLRQGARLCFELQEAFWFYLDYFYEGEKEKKGELPKLNQMEFFKLMMEASDVLRAIYDSPKSRQQLFAEWREYCKKIPLKGAVLLNPSLDKCLMVQPWKGGKWTYPRGKINEGESEVQCAIREVWEETGVAISGRVDVNHYVQADLHGSGIAVKLFLVPDISEEVPCAPNTRKEILKVAWVDLVRLPGWERSWDDSNNMFHSVEPFVPSIKKWVQEQRCLRGLGLVAAGADKPPAPGASMAAAAPPQSVAQEENGAAELAPGKVLASKRVTARLDGGPFQLDVAKVMREFDRGWDAHPASRGDPGRWERGAAGRSRAGDAYN